MSVLTQLGRPGRRADGGVPKLEAGQPLDLGLVLTHACNLACSYCYTGEKKRVRMPLALAERAVELAFDAAVQVGGRLQLSFFGGEPLLEHDLLLALAELARARSRASGCPLLLQVTTNGTLLTAELVRRFGELGVHVALSLDGTRAQHEAGRPLAGGGSSYDATRRGLELLLAARERQPFDVVSVVTADTVDGLGEGVRELLDLGVEALSLNVDYGSAWDEPRLARLEDELEVVAAVMLAWLRRGRWVRIQPLESALRAYAELGRVLPPSCHAGSRRLALAPSGRIYGCSRGVGEDTGKGALGHLDDGLFPTSVAAGGCACASAEETGDPRLAGPVQLRHDRAVERITVRLAARLGAEFERIHVVERGPSS